MWLKWRRRSRALGNFLFYIIFLFCMWGIIENIRWCHFRLKPWTTHCHSTYYYYTHYSSQFPPPRFLPFPKKLKLRCPAATKISSLSVERFTAMAESSISLTDTPQRPPVGTSRKMGSASLCGWRGPWRTAPKPISPRLSFPIMPARTLTLLVTCSIITSTLDSMSIRSIWECSMVGNTGNIFLSFPPFSN